MARDVGAHADRERQRLRRLDDRLDAMSWGAFFIWVGITLLFEIDVGIGLLGVAVIVLGTQAIGSAMGLRVEKFWVGVGLCFLVGGVWEQFSITLPLVPLLLIGLGVLLFFKGGTRGTRADHPSS